MRVRIERGWQLGELKGTVAVEMEKEVDGSNEGARLREQVQRVVNEEAGHALDQMSRGKEEIDGGA